MASPFDYTAVSRKAESLAAQLRELDSYRDDVWQDEALGPLLRVYALLTHRPEAAFDEAVTPERIAECRTYACVLLAAVHDELVQAATLNDAFFDLCSEYDSLVGADLFGAMEAAKADAKQRLAELKNAGIRGRVVARPGSVQRIKRKPKGGEH